MKIREIMSRELEDCAPATNLAAAAELLWNGDCGALPVMDDGRLVGIVTDRDMFIALGTRNRPASEVLVQDLLTGPPLTCNSEDDVATAMQLMRSARVRRLPVVNAAGKLEGIVAFGDIALNAAPSGRSANYEDTVNTMKAICEHVVRKPVMEETRKPATLTATG